VVADVHETRFACKMLGFAKLILCLGANTGSGDAFLIGRSAVKSSFFALAR